MKQKIYTIKNFILIISLAFIFFALAVSESFAMTGSVDLSKDNKVKVCKDVTCANPKPGIIDFNVSGGFPLVIDTEKGISGKVWGDELGWITFNLPYGGVYFADPATGLLKGTAWNENSDVINFSVTGQKVIIDPVTGEWNGWAWASGKYGGWIKFDCKNASCVKTIWNKEESIPIPPPSHANEKVETVQNPPSINFFSILIKTIDDKIKAIDNLYNHTVSFFTNIFTKNSSVPPETNKTNNAPIEIPTPPDITSYIPEGEYLPSADNTSYGDYIFSLTHSPYSIPPAISPASETGENEKQSISSSPPSGFINITKGAIVHIYNSLSPFFTNLKNSIFQKIEKILLIKLEW